MSLYRWRLGNPLRLWTIIAVAVFLVGGTGAVVAARSVAGNAASHARREFSQASTEVAASVQLAIQHEQDLIFSASGFLATDPQASTAQFSAWAATVQAMQRYPELIGLGFEVVVPASGLAAFTAKATADPIGPGAPFQVTPAGLRPFYCFAVSNVSRDPRTAFPPGHDFCAADQGVVVQTSRDSGQAAFSPLSNGVSTVLSVLTPVYRPGPSPSTVAARRAAFLGFVGSAFLPETILSPALAGHSGLAVTMRHDSTASDASFTGGTLTPHAQSRTATLADGWTVQTFGPRISGGVFTDPPAMGLVLGGIGLSALIAALLFVLATGRVRALRMVSHKTDQLRHLALHDPLTGLPNRALILDRLEQLLTRSRRHGTGVSVLYLDLDGFKTVNDTLGHGVGDALLYAVSARLTSGLRDTDTIGRMSGDEFVILIDGASLHSPPTLVAERVLELLAQPFPLDGALSSVQISASVGLASSSSSSSDRDTPEGLLHQADMALYQAKAAGRNGYQSFRSDLGQAIQTRNERELDLRAALPDQQFRLVYQPIYNLEDLSLVGVEALLRWQHPTLGEVQPDEFIPLLESTGQIIEVGRWVLHQACTQMAHWREHGSDLTVSVNISGRQLDQDAILDHVRDALRDSGLDPAALTIEVAETALMRDIDSTARRLRELKDLGVHIAIDDFGTGYSSLADLQRLPVDCLKIDRTFTDSVTQSTQTNAIIHTLVQLGRDLGLKTLAEGVEDPVQIDYLRGQNVDQIQGFLLARPLDPGTLETRFIHPTQSTTPTA